MNNSATSAIIVMNPDHVILIVGVAYGQKHFPGALRPLQHPLYQISGYATEQYYFPCLRTLYSGHIITVIVID